MGQLERKTTDFDTKSQLVFDQKHLQQYTLDNSQLEREVIDLFLFQLPDIQERLLASREIKDWKLWVHTLKGSAVAVGASRICALAVALESPEFHEPGPERELLLARLAELIDEFKALARQLYPPAA